MTFFSIKQQLFKFFDRPNISLKLEEQKIKTSWQDIIESVNKSARDKSQALYINETGELVVSVINNMWLQELSFYKEEIKKQLREKNSVVKSIRLVVGE